MFVMATDWVLCEVTIMECVLRKTVPFPQPAKCHYNNERK